MFLDISIKNSHRGIPYHAWPPDDLVITKFRFVINISKNGKSPPPNPYDTWASDWEAFRIYFSKTGFMISGYFTYPRKAGGNSEKEAFK